MKKFLFFLLIVGLVTVGGWLYSSAVGTPNVILPESQVVTEENYLPWVEVYLDGVLVKKPDEVINHPLKNGDEIEAGDTVLTDETGLATVHMPDGSELRLDVSSEVVLSEFNFNKENNSLGVKIVLLSGRVWSKILALLGTDSFWEVKTNNAVATVRGTAFGVEYSPGKSFFVGSENEVTINGVDPETNQPLINNTAIVGPGKMLEIVDGDISSLQTNDLHLNDQIRDVKPLILERDWIKRSLLQDRDLDNNVAKLRKGGLPESEVREVLKKNNAEEKNARSEQSINAIILDNNLEEITNNDDLNTSSEILDDEENEILADGLSSPDFSMTDSNIVPDVGVED